MRPHGRRVGLLRRVGLVRPPRPRPASSAAKRRLPRVQADLRLDEGVRPAAFTGDLGDLAPAPLGEPEGRREASPGPVELPPIGLGDVPSAALRRPRPALLAPGDTSSGQETLSGNQASVEYTARPVSWISRVLIGIVVAILLVIGALAWLFRSQAEEIPDELPAIDLTEADPMAITIPGGDIDDLVLADLKDKRVYFLLEDRESMEAGESKALNRALARWTIPGSPDSTAGFMIGDAQGFGLFRSKVSEFMGMMRPEMRLPLYIDYEGIFYDSFKLPRGHSGFVLIDRGEVKFRHSGPAEDDDLEAVRELLDATEPAYADAPDFTVGPLSKESCSGKVCLFAFLDEAITRADIPGVEGGWEGEREEGFERFSRPSVRMVGSLVGADEKIDEDKVEGALIGSVEGFEFRRWKIVDPEAAAGAREAFGLGEGAGLVVIDADGKIAFKAEGKIAFWQLGLVADLIDVELGERGGDKD